MAKLFGAFGGRGGVLNRKNNRDSLLGRRAGMADEGLLRDRLTW